MSTAHLFDLSGKVAIITGASKGIGEAIAHLYAQFGAKVVINSRKMEDLTVVAQAINTQGGDCLPYAGNAGDPNDCQNLIQKTLDHYGGVDILVNNAATNPVYGPLVEAADWAFDKIMAVNVKGPYLLSNLAYPSMVARGGGVILNISSIAGDYPDPGLGLYSISKAALNMLTKVQAKEWGVQGIRANAICPGLIKTKFSQALWEDEATLARWVKKIPAARMGTVEEIAGLALFLASPAGAYCTGALFTADGGATLGL